MGYEFKLPDLGEGITEGEIVKWHVKPGDHVDEHQVVVDVETDKAIVEVPSPKTGVVESLGKGEGETVNVGETLLTIGEAGAEEVVEEAPPEEEKIEAAPEEAPKAKAEAEKKEPEKPEKIEEEKRESVSVVGEMPSAAEVLATPKTRRMAKDAGVDLTKVDGTGPGGVITEDDVRKAAGEAPAKAPAPEEKAPSPPVKEAAAPAAPEGAAAEVKIEAGEGADRYGPVEKIPLKGIRRTIARNLIASQRSTAFVTGMDEADVTGLWNIRNREREVAKEQGVHLTFMPFFMKAVWHALQHHPMLNGSVDDTGEFIIKKKYYNIGVAVDTPDGLMVAVVRDVDKKTIVDLARELGELGEKAISRKITLEELKGSSFTITNYGSFAGTFATPIINPPDIAILGTGRIADKPWVVDGEVKVRKVLPLSLTFDHRVVDGVESAKFLHRVIRYLEDPAQIFIEST